MRREHRSRVLIGSNVREKKKKSDLFLRFHLWVSLRLKTPKERNSTALQNKGGIEICAHRP